MMLARLFPATLIRAGRLAIAAFAAVAVQGAIAQVAPAPTALPTGGTVAAGSASISQGGTAQAPVLTVQQDSSRAVLNWGSFNVGRDASVVFRQPDANAAILNRVLDGNPSQVFGNIQSNGQVFLLNPAGVWFGKDSVVDVGSFFATTHAISDDNFMAGTMRFERNGATGSIVNEGTIRSELGGYVALLAPEVRNDGVLLAQSGTILLAAGETATLNFNPANSKVGLLVEPSKVNALVENRKIVKAPDGQVIVSAQAYNELASGVIKNSGEIVATGISSAGGKIVLGASTAIANSGKIDANSAVADGGSVKIDADTVHNSGVINVSSTAAKGKGGDVAITGNYIYIEGDANIDATGTIGGGKVLVGGDWQGSGDLRQAIQVAMDANASINASAISKNNGGTIVLWSDISNPASITQVAGELKATGGSAGGDGGHIETSGHLLDLTGVRGGASAPNGKPGTWLLDPYNVEITSYDQTETQSGGTYTPSGDSSKINVTTVNSLLSGGTNVTITTGSSGSNELGDIMVTSNILKSGSTTSTLRLQAANSIIINGSIDHATGTGNTGKLNLEFDADNNMGSRDGAGISMLNNSLTTNGGYVKFGSSTGGGDVYVGGGSTAVGITTSSGSVNIFGQTIIANTSATGLTITSGGGDITFGGAIDSGNSYQFVSGANGTGTWLQAAQAAKNGTNGGAAIGDSYMVSITSKLENSIATYVAGYKGAWIGAYRDPNTSSWYWIGGPEASGTFAQNGSSPFTAVSGASSVSFFTQGSGLTATGKYQNFGSGEPNGVGSGGENVGQFFGTLGLWNDLPNSTSFSNSTSQYAVWGYVRETNATPSKLTVNAGAGTVTMSGAVGGSKELATLNVTSLGYTASAIKTTVGTTITNSGSVTLASPISGTGGLTKEGAGTLTLSGTNTYTGATNVNAGTLKIANGASIYCDATCGSSTHFGDVATAIATVNTGATLDVVNWNWAGSLGERYYNSNALVINGGTLRYSGASGTAATGGRGFTVGALGATFDSATAGVTWSLTDGGSADYTSIFNGNVSFTGVGDFVFGHAITGANTLTKSGAGTLTLTNANTYSGITTINGGTLQVGNGSTTGTLGTGNVVNNGTLSFNRSNAFVVPNLISGTGSVIKNGAGAVALTAANTYGGTTTLNAGTLGIYNNSALSTSTLTAATGTSLLFGRAVNNVSNNMVLNGAVTFDLDTMVDYLVVGGGGGGGAHVGGGGGGGGVLAGQADVGTGTYSVTVGAGGTGTYNNLGTFTNGTNGSSSSLNLSSGNVVALGGGVGSSYTAQAANNGSTNVSSGGGGGGNTGPGSGTAGQGNTGGASYNNWPYVGGGGGGAGAVGGAAIATPNTNTGAVGGAGGAGLASSITGTTQYYGGGGGGGVHGTGGTFVGALGGAGGSGGGGQGTPLTTNETATSVTAKSGTANTGGGGGGSGGDLSLKQSRGGDGGSGVVMVRYLGGSAGTGGTVTAADGSANGYTLHTFNGSDSLSLRSIALTLSGAISGSGSMTADATGGTMKFSGNSSYTGATSITGGVVQTNSATALGNNSAVTISNLAGVQMQALSSLSIGSLSGGGATGGNLAISSGATLTTGGNNTPTTYSGVISGAGSLEKSGTGTFTLTADNSYNGTTTITGGTLAIGSGGSTGSLGAGNVTDNGTLTFNRTGNYSVSNLISGAGNLIKNGSGNLSLTAANSYSGTTTLNAGKLGVYDNTALGTSAVTAAASTSVVFGPAVSSVANNFTLNGNVNLNLDTVGASSAVLVDLSGTINGIGGITADATGGTLRLSGANGYSGATAINGGVVQANNASALGTNSAVTLANATGTQLQLLSNLTVGSLAGSGTTGGNISLGSYTLTAGGNNTSTSYEGVISGTGALIKSGTGTLILTGNNSYSGSTTISLGTLQLGSGGTSGTLGTGDVTDNATLSFNRSDTYLVSNLISGNGSVSKSGTGNISLMAANTYSGGTALTAGTLGVYRNTSLGSGTLTASANTSLLLGRAVTEIANNIALGGGITVSFDTMADYLVVGGGGGGSSGGGGGGGVVYQSASLTTDTYSITVGAGGAAGVSASSAGGNGGASVFNGSTANGGGGGAKVQLGGLSGASGGGAGADSSFAGGSATQGYAGGSGAGTVPGTSAAGGGGAGGAGSPGYSQTAYNTLYGLASGQNTLGGNGGIGAANSITGTATYYGGGGGGGANNNVGTQPAERAGQGGLGGGGTGAFADRGNGVAGTANTGGGGGGGDYEGSGAAGGSGIVIVRYLGGAASTSGTVTAGTGSSAGYTVQTFTTTGANTLALNPLASTFSGNISGAGSFTANPSAGGKFVFTGANSYSGGTTISSGTLQVGNAAAAGTLGALSASVANNGSLVFNRTDAQAYSGQFSGSGSLTVANTGSLTLTGVASYTGATTVSSSTITYTNNTPPSTSSFAGAGKVIIQPAASGSFTSAFSPGYSFANTLTGVTLGSGSNTQTMTLGSDISIAGPISVFGGTINANANLISSSAGQGILLKSTGGIKQSASTTVQTNGGDITFWSNSTADTSTSTGTGGILVQDGATIDSRRSADRTESNTTTATLGGAITLAGGTATSTTAQGTTVPNNFALNYSSAAAGLILGTDTSAGHASGIKIYSGGGDILVAGRSTQSSQYNITVGLQPYEGLTINAGTNGSLTMRGAAAGISTSAGIDFQSYRTGSTNSASVLTTAGTGSITLTASNTISGGFGLQALGNSQSTALTVQALGTGSVTLTGTTAGTTDIKLSNLNVLAASGDITLNANRAGGTINLGGTANVFGLLSSASVGAAVSASTSKIIFTADNYSLSGTSTLNTSGTVTVQSFGNSFGSALSWPATNLSLGTSVSGLTIGKSTNTANVTISAAQTVAGPVTVYGGDVALNSSIDTSTGGTNGNVLVKATGNINLASSKSITTNGGDITLWSNSAGASTGGIILSNNSTLTSSGGWITLGGSANNVAISGLPATSTNGTVLPQGYAQNANALTGLSLGSSATAGNGQNAGITINSGGGRIGMAGQSTTYSAVGVSSFSFGLTAYNGVNLNSGSGDLVMYGLASGTSTSSGLNYGLISSPWGAAVAATSTWKTNGGNINLTGSATGVGDTNSGLELQGFSASTLVTVENISSTAGSLTFNGNATTATNRYGIRSWQNNILSAKGPINFNVTGSGASFSTVSGYTLNYGYAAGTDVTSTSSPITITSDAMSFSAVNINTGGIVTIQPNSGSFSSVLSFPVTGLTLSSNVGGLTLGKPGNTADITLASAATISGPVNVYGGNITVSGNVNTTGGGANGDVLLKASGDIIFGPAKTVATNGGDVILWANSDGGTANGGVLFDQASGVTTGTGSTGGGHIWIGGSLTNGSSTTWNGLTVGDGFATSGTSYAGFLKRGTTAINWESGVFLDEVTLKSAGGNIYIAGKRNSGSTYGAGIINYSGNGTLIDAGNGTVVIKGESVNTQYLDWGVMTGLNPGDYTGKLTITSSNTTAANAISIWGATASSEDGILIENVTRLLSTATANGGGISVTGSSGSRNALSVGIGGNAGTLEVLSASGAISVDVGSKPLLVASQGIFRLGSVSGDAAVSSSSANVTFT